MILVILFRLSFMKDPPMQSYAWAMLGLCLGYAWAMLGKAKHAALAQKQHGRV